jgi:glycogen debranching enzyme
MLMSKNWMTSVWSWDHCFNAMALTYRNPELAWDQLMVMVDHQDADGAFPDSVNDNGFVWNFCKPPIHGWALRWMMDRTDFIGRKELKEIYKPLAKWTEWWFTYRDSDGDGVPQYNHGNDSGWDNATVFDIGAPVEGPDLAAYLVIQMETLSEVAAALGRKREAKRWRKRADELLKALLDHSWRGTHFVAPRSGDHATAEGDSLLPYLPIVLGKRLPGKVRSALVAGLTEEGRFLTEHGLATESLRSPHYQAEGYWRGPIWAPPTLLIVDGLFSAGERGLGQQIARRFCDMVARSGMAENFDARTGAGLCDPAYTWTASVFQVLAHEYV